MDDKKKIDEEEARVSHRSTSPLTPTDKSPSPSKVQSMFQRGWGALRFPKFVQLNLLCYLSCILCILLLSLSLVSPVASPELFEADRLQPVEIEYFSEHVKNMHENRDKRFEREYQVRQHMRTERWEILVRVSSEIRAYAIMHCVHMFLHTFSWLCSCYSVQTFYSLLVERMFLRE